MIKTHEELLKLHGRKVSCEIEGNKIEDAKIAVEGEKVFICQNERNGDNADDKLGYKYSWRISNEWSKYTEDNSGCTNITLMDEPAQKTSKPTLITVQKEIKKYSDDTTLYSKDSITFNDKEYSISEWKEYVERVRRVNKRFNSLNK